MNQLAEVSTIYEKDPKLKKEDVESLSEWVKAQPHLPELQELQIILFLHSCYYDLEAAQTTIENYCTFRTNSDLCQNVTEDIIRRTLTFFFFGFMPKRTPDGDAVFVTKMLDYRPEIYHPLEQAKTIMAILLLHLHQYGPPNGLIVVTDVKGATLGHFFKMNLSVMRQTMHFVQEAAPLRIKELHHVNSLPITERFINVAKPFMKKELYNKLKFYSHSIEPLYEFVPKECLPEDFGGFLPSIEELKEKNVENIFKSWELLKWIETQKIDDSKRIKNDRGFFGNLFYGS